MSVKHVAIVTIRNDAEWTKTAIKRDLLAALEKGRKGFETLRGAKIRVRSVDED